MCHVRCTSDDCPPRADHFGVHDGHVHVCRRSISLVVMHRIIVIDLHESKTHAIADTDCIGLAY